MAARVDLEKMDFGSKNSGQGPIENATVQPAQMLPNSEPSSFEQAFKQLKEISKSPASIQQQFQVRAILKANPQLEAMCLKQKALQEEQQHEQVRRVQRERQQQQRLMQQLRQRIPNDGYVPQDNTMRPQEVLPNPGPSMTDMQNPTPAWKRLPELEAFLQKIDQEEQEDKLLLEQNPQQVPSLRQRLRAMVRQQMQRVLQRRQRQLMLLRHQMTEHPTMRPRRVMPNLVPSIADRQRSTDLQQQILETFKALNLK